MGGVCVCVCVWSGDGWKGWLVWWLGAPPGEAVAGGLPACPAPRPLLSRHSRTAVWAQHFRGVRIARAAAGACFDACFPTTRATTRCPHPPAHSPSNTPCGWQLPGLASTLSCSTTTELAALPEHAPTSTTRHPCNSHALRPANQKLPLQICIPSPFISPPPS